MKRLFGDKALPGSRLQIFLIRKRRCLERSSFKEKDKTGQRLTSKKWQMLMGLAVAGETNVLSKGVLVGVSEEILCPKHKE